MTLKDLEISLKEFKRFGEKTIAKLEKNGLRTVRDLLFYFPYTYEDLTKVVKIKDAQNQTENQPVLIIGRVSNVKIFRSPRKKFIVVNAVVEDETGKLRVIWFNQYYLAKTFKGNPKIALWGKLSRGKYGLHLSNPSFEKLEIESEKIEVNFKPRILPIYSEISGIKGSFFEKNIKSVFEKYDIKNIQDSISQIPNFQIQFAARYISLGEALFNIHSPKNFEQIKFAKYRLAFEEILYIQLNLLLRKKILSKEKSSKILKNKIEEDKKAIKDFLKNFNFDLTNSQKPVVNEIFRDLQKDYSMNRLLQGEVGSGKTLIAEIAALVLIRNNYQVLMMAPTEILARQHFGRILEDFSALDFGMGLWVSRDGCYGYNGFKAKKTPDEILKMFFQKRINFLVGTHALLEIARSKNKESKNFVDVGLVIIDEQQRFGIAQRKKLLELSSQKFTPHFLTMTATPIPRTLALTFYGDMDLSMIKELPKERKKVETYLIKPDKREKLWGFVNQEILKGHQIFIICPRVELTRTNADYTRIDAESNNCRESTFKEIKAVKEEYERIKKIFPKYNIDLMYGKMKAKEKEIALKKLQNGETQILIASSVIEVGIDLPLATVVIIEGSERFGLSQLHQLRGRVGRSIHQSYCFLVMENYSPIAYSRLKAVVNSNNALELAEKDLEIRGAGELLGERQSGIPDLAMSALKDINLVQQAKEFAEKLISENPELKDLPLLIEEIEKKGIITG